MWIYSPVSQIDDSVRPRKKQERPSRTTFANAFLDNSENQVTHHFCFRNVQQQHQEKAGGEKHKNVEGIFVLPNKQDMF